MTYTSIYNTKIDTKWTGVQYKHGCLLCDFLYQRSTGGKAAVGREQSRNITLLGSRSLTVVRDGDSKRETASERMSTIERFSDMVHLQNTTMP